MARLTATGLQVVLAAAWLASAQAEAAEKSNVVFILADDLGYGDLSCFGQEKFETPHLDALAVSGMRLTRHYSGSTVCAPSRCALLTGAHTGHCYVRANSEQQPIGQLALPDESVTIAELLRDAGYATGAFGKWGLGPPGSEGDPLRQGFDEFFGYLCQRNAHLYYPAFLYDNAERISLDGQDYSHELIVDHACQFIEENADRPFFCYLPVTIPHAALQAPEEEVAEFRLRFADQEEARGHYAGVETQNPAATFAAMVTRLDSDVGRLVKLLETLGIRERTLVVFTSDNGPHQEGGHRPEYFRSAGGFRGVKRDLYEGGIRMPTIVSRPGTVPSGAESDFASASWDWPATLCDFAGAEKPVGSDGVSLVPTLTGQGQQEPHDYLYWEFSRKGGKQAITQGPWKLVRLHLNDAQPVVTELYNVEEDPTESNNLAAERPRVVNDLLRALESVREPSSQFPLYASPK